MFKVKMKDIERIRKDYGVPSQTDYYFNLMKIFYEDDPKSKEVRQIVRVELLDGSGIVIRFSNEEGIPIELIEEQSRFAAMLHENGIETPMQYQSNGHYANWYTFHGYDVMVTVEQSIGEKGADKDVKTAEEAGTLLARMHNIAEKADYHIENKAYSDPFKSGEWFSFAKFIKHGKKLMKDSIAMYTRIVRKYEECLEKLSFIQEGAKYAVQGDFSNSNLYRTEDGKLGIVDYNRCGDQDLFCDAVMQAVITAKVINYAKICTEKDENLITKTFIQAYHRERPFSQEQKEAYPYLCGLIRAFWNEDMYNMADDLKHIGGQTAYRWMCDIYERLCYSEPMDWLELEEKNVK